MQLRAQSARVRCLAKLAAARCRRGSLGQLYFDNDVVACLRTFDPSNFWPSSIYRDLSSASDSSISTSVRLIRCNHVRACFEQGERGRKGGLRPGQSTCPGRDPLSRISVSIQGRPLPYPCVSPSTETNTHPRASSTSSPTAHYGVLSRRS